MAQGSDEYCSFFDPVIDIKRFSQQIHLYNAELLEMIDK